MNEFQPAASSVPMLIHSVRTLPTVLKGRKVKQTLMVNKVLRKMEDRLLRVDGGGKAAVHKMEGRRLLRLRRRPRLHEIEDHTSFPRALVLPLRAVTVRHSSPGELR